MTNQSSPRIFIKEEGWAGPMETAGSREERGLSQRPGKRMARQITEDHIYHMEESNTVLFATKRLLLWAS